MRRVLEILDWFVMVVERLLVLGLAVLISCFGWRLLRGSFSQGQLDGMKSLSENWKVGLILLIVLFYGTVRKFLEEVHEFAGMKRMQHGTEVEERPIPPKAVAN